MNLRLKFILLGFALSAVAARAQLVLQNFTSVVGSNTYFYGTWEASSDAGGTNSPNAHFSQGSGTYDITGTTSVIPTDDAGSKVEFFNASAVNVSGYSYLSVTAQALAGNGASSFKVFLVDTSGRSAFASFATSAFATGSYSTAYGVMTLASGFNAASIDSMIISGDQLGGTATFNVSFDQIAAISAIPEPATYAAILGGVVLVGAVMRRRRGAGNRRSERGADVSEGWIKAG